MILYIPRFFTSMIMCELSLRESKLSKLLPTTEYLSAFHVSHVSRILLRLTPKLLDVFENAFQSSSLASTPTYGILLFETHPFFGAI